MEIPFPSFTDSYGLVWPRIQNVTFAWAHPGQRYHSTPGGVSGVLVERAEGFWTGVLNIFPLPKYVIEQGFGDEIALWLARLDVQGHTTRIPHKRAAGSFISANGVKLQSRRPSSGGFLYDIVKTGILEDFRDYAKVYTGMFLEIAAGQNIAKRIVRLQAKPSDSSVNGNTTLQLFPSLKYPTVRQEGDSKATLIKPTETILTRSANDRPIPDPRSINTAGPWIYAWKEELLP